MNKGLIAITFPDINGANQMLDALNKSIQGDISQISDVLIIEKDTCGNLKTKKPPRFHKVVSLDSWFLALESILSSHKIA